MPDLWDVELKKGESSNDIDRNRNCSNSVHSGKMRRSNVIKTELQGIRRKWRLQQQQMKSHQRRKEILIKEYEIQREQRLKQSTGGMHLFKGPEGTQIDSTELRKIKVDIYRSIPGKSTANNEIQRDIVNPEDVIVKRRAGEGTKPIFEREELTRAVSNTEDVGERRIVATVKNANSENKQQSSKRRSASLSLTRNRSHNQRRTSSRCSRHEDYKQGGRENRRNNSFRGRSRNRSKERKEGRRRTQSRHAGDEDIQLNERKSRRDHSRSRDRDSHHSRSIRGRSKERRMPLQQIPVVEQIPIPVYYGNFPPRPVMVGPLVPIRGHVAFGGSRYSMWPMRPFGPRFPPNIDMFRLRPPGNPRGFRPQY